MEQLFVIISLFLSVNGFLLRKPLNTSSDSHFGVLQEVYKNVGQPLYLTPHLEAGRIQRARQLSKVHLPGFQGITSWSGYLTVNKECESNLFFWFFPAQRDWQNAPVVLWLQGGPGASSLYGLFEELGPIQFSGRLKKRRYSWNVKHNLLFIDQPVGTGFSFTRNGCYATNETEVSRDVYSALLQFYQLFPSLKKNKFYVTGESYAGHYVPSVAYAIHKNNPSAKTKINLSGLMIGNGLMDEMYQSDYSSYLYQLGLVDSNQRDVLKGIEKKMINYLKNENWELGFNTSNYHYNLLRNFVGDVDDYNFLKKYEDPTATEPWEKFIKTPHFRKTLHVGSNSFHGLGDYTVYSHLTNDYVQSVKSKVEDLLEHYPVIFYYGQLDIVCAYPMAVNFFRNLQWSGAKDYLQAKRQQWCVQGELAGYTKSAHNLHEVLVRAAGHMVPKDQPLWAFELVNSVTSGPAHDPLRQLRTCGMNSSKSYS